MGYAHRNKLPAERRKRGTPGEIAQAKKRGILAEELLYCQTTDQSQAASIDSKFCIFVHAF
jgi:hypothetical protein